MPRILNLHPDNPQARLIAQAVEVIQRGGVLAFPTDSGYALGCALGDKAAMERIRSLRGLDDKHFFTLMVRDLSEIAVYARVDNIAYRFLRQYTPGAYTFILPASHEAPRRLDARRHQQGCGSDREGVRQHRRRTREQAQAAQTGCRRGQVGPAAGKRYGAFEADDGAQERADHQRPMPAGRGCGDFGRTPAETGEAGLILVKGRKITIPDVEKLRGYDL